MKIGDMVFGIINSISHDDLAILTEASVSSNPAALVTDGAEFDFAGIRFIRLGEEQGGILCVTKDATERMVFNNDWKNNNYGDSEVRKYILQCFVSKLPRAELLPYEMDLKSSSDPRDGYGCCTDMAGILTEELYRKYIRFIHVDDWEWLCTPYSSFLENPWVRYVSTSGYVNNNNADNAFRCRPTCIFKKII